MEQGLVPQLLEAILHSQATVRL